MRINAHTSIPGNLRSSLKEALKQLSASSSKCKIHWPKWVRKSNAPDVASSLCLRRSETAHPPRTNYGPPREVPRPHSLRAMCGGAPSGAPCALTSARPHRRAVFRSSSDNPARGCDRSIGAIRRARPARNGDRRAPSQHGRVYCRARALTRWRGISTTRTRAKPRSIEGAITSETPSGTPNKSEITMHPSARIVWLRPRSLGQAQILARKMSRRLVLLGATARPSSRIPHWGASRCGWPGARNGVQDTSGHL